MKKLLLLAAITALTSCTDAEQASLGSYGSKATVTCWSGGKIIYQGESTGKVMSNEHGNGVYFKSATTGKFVHTYADCITEQD